LEKLNPEGTGQLSRCHHTETSGGGEEEEYNDDDENPRTLNLVKTLREIQEGRKESFFRKRGNIVEEGERKRAI
jgi:hypothetical protein